MALEQRAGQLVCPAFIALGIPALYVHDLTGTEDANRLLSKPPPVHPATSNVLANLRRWNPEVAATFSEKESAVGAIPFKLVTTSPSWTSLDIDRFVAVSYCWHSDEWEVPLRFDNAPDDWSFPLSPAMLKALLSNFDHAATVFWLDQLCIDQNDSEQKIRAIANMDTIYRNAAEVAILLEDFDISLDAERSLRMLARYPPGALGRMYLKESALSENFSSCFHQGATQCLFEFSNDVFECRWFSRAWCSQEYQLNGKRTFLFVGHFFDCLALESTFFAEFHQLSAEASDEDNDLYTHPVFQTFSFGIGVNNPDEVDGLNLALLFVEVEKLSCSQMRDIISIALNTSGIFLTYVGDVSSRADCQFKLGLLLLAAGYPIALDSIGPPLYNWPGPSHQGLLRWPLGDDFRYFADEWSPTRITSAHNIKHLCRESVTLDLFILTSERIRPSAEHTDAAEAWRARALNPRSATSNVEIETFAVAVHIGLPWIAVKVRDFQLETPLVGSPKIIEGWSTAKNGPTILQDTAPEDMFALAEVLTWFVLVNLRRVDRTSPVIIALNNTNTRYAILFIPLRLTQHDLNELIFAVPAALAGSTAACVRRLWVLAKAKTSQSSLAMVGQGYYFGDELRADDQVLYAQDVTVVGRWHEAEYDWESAEEWMHYDEEGDDSIHWDSDGGRW